jgi:hypothetical protein
VGSGLTGVGRRQARAEHRVVGWRVKAGSECSGQKNPGRDGRAFTVWLRRAQTRCAAPDWGRGRCLTHGPQRWVRERWAAHKQAVAADGLRVKRAGLTCLAHLGKENIFLFLFNIFPKAQKSH